MKTEAKVALVTTSLLAAAGGAYYFLVYKSAQKTTGKLQTVINQAVQSNQVKPSQYDGQLIRSPDTGKVYLVTNGYKQWITSPGVLTRLGYNMGQVKDLSPSVVDAIPESSSLSGILISGLR
ncbi:hypothetical protein WSM22_02840 [Cytophagales bacterium WSM2-2]|nr:hypothetical protein WSM22_02840 [Cytophagales bacterium WSM2-2]